MGFFFLRRWRVMNNYYIDTENSFSFMVFLITVPCNRIFPHCKKCTKPCSLSVDRGSAAPEDGTAEL